jgi:antirestriction protein ArdC
MTKFSKTAAKPDVYAQVTDAIIAQLEAGARPWAKSWKTGNAGGDVGPFALPKRSTGEAYQGINVVLLWGAKEANGFTSNQWFTFNQAKEAGGFVRKGSKGSMVVYAGAINVEKEGENGETEEQRIPFMKTYTVFNRDQIEGLADAEPVALPVDDGANLIASAQTYFDAIGATVRHGGDRAYWSGQSDHIQMPPRQAFADGVAYYATLGHEHIHWSGAKHRLDREFGKRFGDDRYAFEELVAELGAAFLMASLGLSSDPREDHAAYLAGWLKVLKADKRAIFTAASKAQAAVNFLNERSAQAGQALAA